MRNVAIVVAALAVALLGSTAGTGTSSPSGRATLKLVRGAPLELRGVHFIPGERVRVRVVAEGSKTRRVTANGSGGFVVQFPTVTYDRCSGLLALAIGSRGSRAGLKRPPLLCPPRL